MHWACRHPLDQQNTAIVRAIPGLMSVAKGLLGEDLVPSCNGLNHFPLSYCVSVKLYNVRYPSLLLSLQC